MKSEEFKASKIEASTEEKSEEIKQRQNQAKQMLDDSNLAIVIAGNSDKEEITTQVLSYEVDAVDLMALIESMNEAQRELEKALKHMVEGDFE